MIQCKMSPIKVNTIPKDKGVYILIFKLNTDKTINIGSLGNVSFEQGFYLYIGSAMGGLRKRISAHLSQTNRLRWHVDYLSKEATLIQVCYRITSSSIEDEIALKMAELLKPIPRFGSSDSKKTKSHLFFSRTQQECEQAARECLFIQTSSH